MFDSLLMEIMEASNGLLPGFLDVIFEFLSKFYPKLLLSSDGISIEHLLSQALNKWQTHLKNKEKSWASEPASQQCATQLCQSFHQAASTQDQTQHNAMISRNIEELERQVVTEQVNVTSGNDSSVLEAKSSDMKAGNKDIVYQWSQTIDDVDIQVPLPSNIMRGKQVCVTINSDTVRVALPDGQQLLAGSLHQPVVQRDSMWDLTPGQHVTLHLMKREAVWWRDAVVGVKGRAEGSQEAERPYASLSLEEQATLRRAVFDAEQRALGAPTSQALQMEHVLRSAWHAEGSPFQGQPYDLSQVELVTPEL